MVPWSMNLGAKLHDLCKMLVKAFKYFKDFVKTMIDCRSYLKKLQGCTKHEGHEMLEYMNPSMYSNVKLLKPCVV